MVARWFDVFRVDGDDGAQQLQCEIVVLVVGRGLDPGHQQIGGVTARYHPHRPDALLDRLGAVLVGRDLQRVE
jgi:hypothetical protein